MSGSPPPRSSQLPTSPTGYFRPRRSRKPPDKYGVWVSDRRDMCVIPDLVLSSDEELSDDSDETIVQHLTPKRLVTVSPLTPTGPPPARVTGPPFSPRPFILSPSSSPGSAFSDSPTSQQVPGDIQEVAPVLQQGGASHQHQVLQGGGVGDEEELYDQQDGADPQVVAPALLDVPNDRGGGLGHRGSGRVGVRRSVRVVPPSAQIPQVQPAPPPVLVQLGGAGVDDVSVRQAALQVASRQGAGFADRYSVSDQPLPPPPAVATPLSGSSIRDTLPSQASQDIPVNLDDLPHYHVVHRQHIPTITHVPKAARSDWTRLYTNVCYRVANNPSNLANHILYSMLARVILPAGKAPPHPGDTTQAVKVKERIRRWRAGEFRSLWEEAISMQKVPAKRKRRKQQQTVVSQEERNATRASRLIKEGQYSRAA